jgi:hypothetical protein
LVQRTAGDRPKPIELSSNGMMPLDRAGRSIALKFFSPSGLPGIPHSRDQVCSDRRRK